MTYQQERERDMHERHVDITPSCTLCVQEARETGRTDLVGKRRRLVLQVELDMDRWTSQHIGTDASYMDDLKETITDSLMGGVIVTVRKLATTAKES